MFYFLRTFPTCVSLPIVCLLLLYCLKWLLLIKLFNPVPPKLNHARSSSCALKMNPRGLACPGTLVSDIMDCFYMWFFPCVPNLISITWWEVWLGHPWHCGLSGYVFFYLFAKFQLYSIIRSVSTPHDENQYLEDVEGFWLESRRMACSLRSYIIWKHNNEVILKVSWRSDFIFQMCD